MQNVTDHAFLRVIADIGPPDYFFTEYFSVYPHSRLDPGILRSITENETGRPVFAQVLGNNAEDLARVAADLAEYPVAGVDLNLGCPAPKIYKRNAGGGLLRDPEIVDTIIGRMRERLGGRFSVKCRLGFEDDSNFERCLESVRRHGADFLTVHGRTVRQMYRGEVDYASIAIAGRRLDCPVFANGNLTSASVACEVVRKTGCFGAMVGRSAIRNPWIFRQIREQSTGRPVFAPTLGDVRAYIDELYRAKKPSGMEEKFLVAHLKRYLVFIGEGVDAGGRFLHEVRRVGGEADLFRTCDRHLIEGGKGDQPFHGEPFEGVKARPNRE